MIYSVIVNNCDDRNRHNAAQMVFWAAAEHGYRTACCPECGWKLELVTSFAKSDDYENRDAANGILWCHSCHAHRKAEDWVINRFN